VTAVPALVTADAVIGSGHVISGASATGAGAGVGALGELHPAQQMSARSVTKTLVIYVDAMASPTVETVARSGAPIH
jgi:hypothetical protein